MPEMNGYEYVKKY